MLFEQRGHMRPEEYDRTKEGWAVFFDRMEVGLRRHVRRLGLDGAVIFAGQVPEAAKVDYYRLADVFVFPSAQLRMTRARKDKAWAEVGRRTQRSSVSRSSWLNCNG